MITPDILLKYTSFNVNASNWANPTYVQDDAIDNYDVHLNSHFTSKAYSQHATCTSDSTHTTEILKAVLDFSAKEHFHCYFLIDDSVSFCIMRVFFTNELLLPFSPKPRRKNLFLHTVLKSYVCNHSCSKSS